MARVKIRYYSVIKGRGFWRSNPAMQAMGFPPSVPLGPDGPDAWARAEEWNDRWDKARRGEEAAPVKVYPRGSLGEAFDRFRRTEEWAGKAASTRSEWDQAWKSIEPVFGDIDPSTVTLEDLSEWYHAILKAKGVDTSWRAMKIWRALWQVASAMRYCDKDRDPSAGVNRQSQPKRSARWSEGEVVRLVKRAWRQGWTGLACIVAVTWDTQFSPGDVRTLTSKHATSLAYPKPRLPIAKGRKRPPAGTEAGLAFSTGRAKTGRPAIGTLSRRTRRLVAAYLKELGSELHPDAPIFRATDGDPYQAKDRLSKAFGRLREIDFPEDTRTLMDMRRSGAVEAMAGGVDPGALAAKMANTIDDAKDLQATYIPVDAAVVKLADEARRRGRTKLREAT